MVGRSVVMLAALGARTSAFSVPSLSRAVPWTSVRHSGTSGSRTRVSRLLAIEAPVEAHPVVTDEEVANDTPCVESSFLQILVERGFYHQCTNVEGLDEKLGTGEAVKGYLGFDATADRCACLACSRQ